MTRWSMPARAAVVLVSVAACAVSLAGTAAAKDPFVGLAYADASSKVASRGGTAVISTVVGSQLSTDACIVQ